MSLLLDIVIFLVQNTFFATALKLDFDISVRGLCPSPSVAHSIYSELHPLRHYGKTVPVAED